MTATASRVCPACAVSCSQPAANCESEGQTCWRRLLSAGVECRTDPHQRRAGRVSTQVLNDFYRLVTTRLQPPMPNGDARAEVRRYQRWQPWAIDHATVESAWSIESRFGLAYMDALVVAAAKAQGCELLLDPLSLDVGC